MYMFEINFVAIVLAAVAAFIVGFLMHGPIAGKLWMRLAGIVPTGNEKFSDMVPQMAWNLVANLFTATVMSFMFLFSNTYFGLSSDSAFAFMDIGTKVLIPVLLLWVFAVAGSSMEVIWMGRKMKLWLFECLCTLLSLLAMGAVMAMFY